MSVFRKDAEGNFIKVGGFMEKRFNPMWFECKRVIKNDIETYIVPEVAKDYFTLGADKIYYFGIFETNTTNSPKIDFFGTLLPIHDLTQPDEAPAPGTLQGVYQMFTDTDMTSLSLMNPVFAGNLIAGVTAKELSAGSVPTVENKGTPYRAEFEFGIPVAISLPDGGTTGQILTKKSDTNYDVEWTTESSAVTSVNGQTGEVVLTAKDIGAETANGGGKIGQSAYATTGGAIGQSASSIDGGGAVGQSASATTGGAVGCHAKSINGGGGAIGNWALANNGGGAVGEYARVQYGNGGGAVGYGAKADGGGGAVGYKTLSTGGAAVGNITTTKLGGAVGAGASSTDGGAVGEDTKTSDGFAGGKSAKTIDSSNNGIDAIQLGTGTNGTAKTLQCYDYTMMNADGSIPAERLTNSPVTSVNGQTGAVVIKTSGGSAETTEGGGAVGQSASATYGGAVGNGATTTDGGAVGQSASATTGGGAVGYNASATSGGAVGQNASVTNGGGAVGAGTSSTNGGAVGYYAKATNGGGAVGSGATTVDGGAVGFYATTISGGCAVGNGAKAIDGAAIGYHAEASSPYGSAIGYGAQVAETDGETIQLGSSGTSALKCQVALTVTSDKRDKADIVDVCQSLEFINKLNPVTFVSNGRDLYISEENKHNQLDENGSEIHNENYENYKKYGMCDYDAVAHAHGTLKGERRRIGLLAQDVQSAMQEVYGTDNYADIVNDNFYDLADKPMNVENKLTLAYQNLIPFLIGAIKELKAELDELKGK